MSTLNSIWYLIGLSVWTYTIWYHMDWKGAVLNTIALAIIIICSGNNAKENIENQNGKQNKK